MIRKGNYIYPKVLDFSAQLVYNGYIESRKETKMSYRDELELEIETVKDIIANVPGGKSAEFKRILKRLQKRLQELN